VTDIAWRRVNHPTEVLTVGQTVKVKIIKINQETHRISLGMKQLMGDPWAGIEAKYPIEAKFKGRVTNITDYGAFVELEPGIEGLIHVSEMSWTKKNVHPGKILSTSQEVEVQMLEVDSVQAPHLARPQADPGQPVGCLRRQAPDRVGCRRRGQEQDRVRSVHRPRRRCRRHGPSLRSRLEPSGRAGHRRVQEGRRGQGGRSRRRHREGAHQPRHQAGAGRSLRRRRRDPQGPGRHLRDHRGQGLGGLEVKLVGTDLSAFIKRSELARDRAASSAPSASPPARRWTPASSCSTARPARSRCRSRRWKWPKRRKPWPSTARPTRAPRSATFSAPR
jgi:small subunit ribosomal protein S1